MRTLIIFTFLITIYYQKLHAQNLVPNPSFEDISQCPFTAGQLDFANNWFIAAGTPDLFNTCANPSSTGVPINARGNQNALNGQGYSFIVNYQKTAPNYREVIGTQLTQPLLQGEKYFFSFFVSLADTLAVSCVTNNFGLKLSNNSYSFSNPIAIDNNPFYNNSIFIENKDNWTSLTGSFNSDSNYNFIYIGNFFDDLNTDTIDCGASSQYSGYFIDQICISTDSILCSFYTLINHQAPIGEFVSITNSIILDNLTINNNSSEQFSVAIFDGFGCKLADTRLNSGSNIISMGAYPSALYYVKILSSSNSKTYKILKL